MCSSAIFCRPAVEVVEGAIGDFLTAMWEVAVGGTESALIVIVVLGVLA